MDDDVQVYDLGEVRNVTREPRTTRRPPLALGDGAHRATTRAAPAVKPTPKRTVLAFLPVSLSLFVPGSGHVLQRRYVAGIAWAGSFFALLGALAGSWSILPRLWAAADALGAPPQAAIWVLGVLAVLTAAVHEIGVLFAGAYARPRLSSGVHPAAASVASLLIPGWGQLLNGHLVRGGLFLFVVWSVVAAWLLASAPVQEMLIAYQLHLPAPLAALASEPVRWALAAAVWPLAVYDAGLSARAARP
jgi:hypothetical protein